MKRPSWIVVVLLGLVFSLPHNSLAKIETKQAIFCLLFMACLDQKHFMVKMLRY